MNGTVYWDTATRTESGRGGKSMKMLGKSSQWGQRKTGMGVSEAKQRKSFEKEGVINMSKCS